MTFARREKVTASEVAQRLGKSVEETKEILLQAADVGILSVNSKYNNKNGEDVLVRTMGAGCNGNGKP